MFASDIFRLCGINKVECGLRVLMVNTFDVQKRDRPCADIWMPAWQHGICIWICFYGISIGFLWDFHDISMIFLGKLDPPALWDEKNFPLVTWSGTISRLHQRKQFPGSFCVERTIGLKTTHDTMYTCDICKYLQAWKVSYHILGSLLTSLTSFHIPFSAL